MRAIIFCDRPGDRHLAARTRRALATSGTVGDNRLPTDAVALGAAIQDTGGPVWIVRAGAWPVCGAQIAPPPASATGRAVAAVGAVRLGDDADSWVRFLEAAGGDLSAHISAATPLPTLASVYLDARAAGLIADRLVHGAQLADALATARDLRLLHLSAFDVADDCHIRILQIITSLQRGGAERIALSLAMQLRARGHHCPIVTLGRPTRTAFTLPADWIDVSRCKDRQHRADALHEIVRCEGIDLVHGHLIDQADAALVSRSGVPLLLTIHNTRAGWPVGLEHARRGDASVLIACAQAVEGEMAAAGIPIPMRTIWNGIDFSSLAPEQAVAATGLRDKLGIARSDFVVLALANPRPQKRWHLLPAILAATQARLAPRIVRLLLAGEAAAAHPAAQESLALIKKEIERHGVADRITWLGMVEDIAPLLRASDVMVSVSAHEGLSLAQLEALGSDIPLVATAVGGTAELAHNNPACMLLPAEASPADFAEQLESVATKPRASGRSPAVRDFSLERMTDRYEFLYRCTLTASQRQPGAGLWLITNNFSTGGAQSSARRLLLGLAAQGVRVRAATLEEDPDNPTPGRRALLSAGIPVLPIPPAAGMDPLLRVAALLEAIDADAPAAVLFWNALAEYKLLLADGLIDIPVFDISPGEMYFASLERYFANPRPGVPYRSAADYGRRLASVIVKFHAERTRAQALGAPVHVIPNGVPLPELPSPRAPAERLVIGTLARINPQKKLEQLLAALRIAHSSLPSYVLRIAGNVESGCGDYLAALQQQADGLDVDWVGERESAEFLRELDLFAMISEPAGCPNASLEAMAHALPVVATDVGGAAEQIIDGKTGRLVPRGDAEQFAAGLLELAGDEWKRRRWGEAGRRHIAEHFGVERMVEDYARVCLNHAIRSRGPTR